MSFVPSSTRTPSSPYAPVTTRPGRLESNAKGHAAGGAATPGAVGATAEGASATVSFSEQGLDAVAAQALHGIGKGAAEIAEVVGNVATRGPVYAAVAAARKVLGAIV